MMKVMVPYETANLPHENLQDLEKRLKQLEAKEILLVIGEHFETIDEYVPILEEYLPFFEKIGVSVMAWIVPTISGYGLNFTGQSGKTKNIYGETTQRYCPLYDEHVDYYCQCVKKIVACGIKRIMLEDDFRMHSPVDYFQCFCDKHLELYSELLGEQVTIEKMREELRKSEPSKYREAWMQGNQMALERFAKKVRDAVDEVSSDVEIVFDCGPCLWGGDGTNPIAIADILAGSHKKEMRLIGAPYWQRIFRHILTNMISVVDYTRHQAYECKKHGDITVIAEGDVFPRPRYACPAAYLETFHTILLADGNFDKISKYALDYTSSVNYEKGYAKEHEHNAKLYLEIERIFKGKTAQGIHLVEPFELPHFTHKLNERPEQAVPFSPSREILNANSIPAVFEPGSVNLIFGENARNLDLDLLQYGSILDMEAAKILAEQGVDTGYVSCETAELQPLHINSPSYEKYLEYGEKTSVHKIPQVYDVILKEGAHVQSEFSFYQKQYVASYTYENTEGNRFLVLCLDTAKCNPPSDLFRNYCRQRQLMDGYTWLGGKQLSAICAGHPDLYLMVKTDTNGMAIGLWNYFADKIRQPEIVLSETYSSAEFINCQGKLEGNRVVITSTLYAYEFCFVCLKKAP